MTKQGEFGAGQGEIGRNWVKLGEAGQNRGAKLFLQAHLKYQSFQNFKISYGTRSIN